MAINENAVLTRYTPEMLLELQQAASEDMLYEIHMGDLIAMPLSGDTASELALEIARLISNLVREYRLGRVTGADGGYILTRDPATLLYAPDVGFIAKDSAQPRTGKFYEGAPDLAVEVISPHDRAGEIHTKVQNYLKYGTRAVWVVYPDTRTLTVHLANGARTLGVGDVLDGGDILPGFSLRISDLFAILDE
jgi:Uma2 family endonuclease